MFKPGERVTILYVGYEVEAEVIHHDARRGWVTVEQITDFEDRDKRPRFEAAEEFIYRPGEPVPLGPLEVMENAMHGLWGS